VRRILAGEKTQTRRIVKPQPQDGVIRKESLISGPYWKAVTGQQKWSCPYGHPGDVLWVREAFRLPAIYDDQTPSWYTEKPVRPVKYCADDAYVTNEEVVGTKPIEWGRKRPSIHMPRELCRLRLRVEDVRVEQVQEISYEDVVAEGLESHVDRERYGQKRTVKYPWSLIERDDLPDTGHSVQDYDYAFKKLWNDIHGDGAWERNEWVWVVSFSRITE
jgi:hypothetical protein